MRTEMAVESLLELVERSGVIAGDQMQHLLKEFRERRPQLDSPRQVADELVARGMLTRWQAEHLLSGKHRGFLLGPYRILDLLGSGGMGRVYLAEHQMMHRRCAIKILPPKESQRESSIVDRFYREAQAVAALDHPNIVRAYDVNKARIDETEVHYLVMEYVDGQDLQRMVERQGGLEYRQAADYIRQAAQGLAHAHQRGLLHRDIKPANLIVDAQGVVKILDLGLACCYHDDDALAAAERGEGVLGTADYVAPEQAVNSQNIDERADIYSLGQTFYFLLTCHPPFPEGTVPERLFAHQTKTPQPINTTRPDAPPGLLAIIDRMTAKEPAQRYPSAKQVVEALEAWLAEHGDESSLRGFAARVVKGIVPAPPSSDVSTDAGTSASEDTELELAPLDEDEPPPSKRAAGAANKHGRTPPRGDVRTAPQKRSRSATPADSQAKPAKADKEGPVLEDLPDLGSLEKDLISALEGKGLASGHLGSELAPAPPGAQALPGRPRLRKPARRVTLARLLELPAFWISVAVLVVVVLIVGIVLSLYSTDKAQRQPAGGVSGETTREMPPAGPSQTSTGDALKPPGSPPPPPGRDGQKTSHADAPPAEHPGGSQAVIPPGGKSVVIVPVGSTWKWLHPTDGVDPATEDKDFHTTFSTVEYDDSHWQAGRDDAGPEAGFGYGDPVRVDFEMPPKEHRKTAYFRHAFSTQVPMKNLVLSLQRDDGVIVYLDGKEVGRDNVGSGKEAYDLFAEDTIRPDVETRVIRLELSGSLPPGQHVLGISLHNRPRGSSDLRIAEISLIGAPARNPDSRTTRR